jgi:single-strand DNA-binding protein
MTLGLNQATLIGNVGQVPEIRYTEDGKQIAYFSLATTDSWRDKETDEKRERTEWHKIVIFHQGIVSIVKEYVKKGSKLYVQGNIRTREWEKDGEKRYITEIILQSNSATLVILDSKKGDKEDKIQDTKVNQ